MSQTIAAPGLSLTQSYSYDLLNRLQTASESGCGLAWSQTYGYDVYGNRWVEASSTPPPAAVTPTGPSWFNGANNRILFSGYDLSGNQTQAGGGTFTFDAENRQTRVTVDVLPGNVFTYAYDGDGRRVKRVVAGITRIYVYNVLGQMVAEYHSPNSPCPSTLRKEFIHLGGRLLAAETNTPSASGCLAETKYLTPDHLGSTRVVTDAAATVDSRHDYLPFGKEIPAEYGGPRWPATARRSASCSASPARK